MRHFVLVAVFFALLTGCKTTPTDAVRKELEPHHIGLYLYNVIVDYDRGLDTFVGMRDWMKPQNAVYFRPETKTGVQEVSVILLWVDGPRDAKSHMRRFGYRALTTTELLSFGEQYPEWRETYDIMTPAYQDLSGLYPTISTWPDKEPLFCFQMGVSGKPRAFAAVRE